MVNMAVSTTVQNTSAVLLVCLTEHDKMERKAEEK